jgi:hypothetical protein
VGSGGIFVGTSGWTYADWAGKFYPREVKGSQRLAASWGTNRDFSTFWDGFAMLIFH